jgi:hypothetical protein
MIEGWLRWRDIVSVGVCERERERKGWDRIRSATLLSLLSDVIVATSEPNWCRKKEDQFFMRQNYKVCG